MDDLSGLTWTPASGSESKKPPPMSSASAFSDLRPTPPTSGWSTPLSSGPAAPQKSPSKAPTPANDSFANLVSFNSASSNKNLSLLEQQKRLTEQRARQEAQKKAQLDAQFGGGSNAQFWDTLEKPQTARSPAPPDTLPGRQPSADEDDLLAAFNASAPVDASTNFPVPSSGLSSTNTPSLRLGSNNTQSTNPFMMNDDDDDPFGLNRIKQQQAAPQHATSQDDEDDVLGLLGKPVSEFEHKSEAKEPSRSPSPVASAADRYIAELVDMGFPADKAREALAATESGTNVQAAVGLLLNQAHEEAKQKSKGRGREASADRQEWQADRTREDSSRRRQPEPRDHGVPAWMQNEDRSRPASRTASRSPATVEKDASALAAQFGNNLFKSANSLWKTGTKKMQQAVQEFNAPSDSSQPRWMREAPSAQETTHSESRPSAAPKPSNFTDEAILLEMGAPPSKPSRPRQNSPGISEPDILRSRSPQAAFQRDMRPQFKEDRRSRLSRVNAEEQAAQAYISPARRRKAAPTPPASESQPDLFEPSSSVSRQPTRPATTSPLLQTRHNLPSKPLPVRPKAPPRETPQVAPSALASSHSHRVKGSEAFKRGDYAAAHASYSTALSQLPAKHPVTIILLCNRALTGLKIGEPKSAIQDADTAISVIGPSRGESEKIDLGNGEPGKDMREFFGKALMRKAEALEQLEKWSEAAKIWRDAVEAGHGGGTSIQGRNRCEKAAGINQPTSRTSTPASSARPIQSRKPATPAARPARPAANPAKSAEAVNRLRAANEAADRADSEKFALADAVEARLNTWKGGKQDNLRALLASLDTVLWPEAGWKKISMAELIMPNKVKIQYMKGIGKVHPDKIPIDATTEQKMIAGAVFSALNEAWDKFKRENNL
ncbi:hypothetical protein AJ79_01876 [Helicocarpus griseus UAMH5409]|uniref:UBA domain-containing protein n=1 Tax=Helicocarpus griseus UAMH5409 TaxID=1447875 RepID=A0A2B7XX27_9EURO|nr:hypothetical protein AJ79_01876 [Helicocarpus griseus UAMH5409]